MSSPFEPRKTPALNPARLEDEITAFWSEWETRHETSGFSIAEICRDGIGDLAMYCTAQPRVLVVLREPNNSRGEDLLNVLRNGPVFNVWHNVARWAGGALLGFPSFETVNAPACMRETLRSIAVINLKKQSGGASSDMAEVHAFAARFRTLLVRQIDILAPTVVLACGTLEPLVWLLDLEVRKDQPIRATLPSGVAFSVLPSKHAAARASARGLYAELASTSRTLSYTLGSA